MNSQVATMGAEEASLEAGGESAKGRKFNWYVLQVHSGFETQVQKQIEEQCEKDEHMRERIGEVKVPIERVVGVRRGKRHQTERKFFPGYVLIAASLDDITEHVLKNMPKVMDFLGYRE